MKQARTEGLDRLRQSTLITQPPPGAGATYRHNLRQTRDDVSVMFPDHNGRRETHASWQGGGTPQLLLDNERLPA